jgi:hypothetical protein
MHFKTPVWVGAALAGLALAGGLTTAAAQLSNQSVGISSEPVTAGDRLVPVATPSPTPTPTTTPRATRTATPVPTRTAVPTVDANGGHGSDDGLGDDRGGRGRGGDD